MSPGRAYRDWVSVATNTRASLPASLFHDPEEIAFGVFDPHEPQIVIGHACDHIRFLMDRDVFGFCVGQQRIYVGSSEVEERLASVMFGGLSRGEIKADATAIEEGHVWGGHQDGQTERVAVKRRGTVDFFHGDSDLEDSGE